ncbi:hypothetical protein BdWA1_002881 [Babesia duncani]|uniref:FUN14 family protein n=1 Tax=Babesia duncani TaxID=323732 RepID=A0AAD9PIV2_9APIC|nr:hypothetical protein BdWA1_002881 [Babesia duncani]
MDRARDVLSFFLGHEEFDSLSFTGGLCFGMGSSIVVTKALRGAFLICTGGLFSLVVSFINVANVKPQALSKTGCVEVNWKKLGLFATGFFEEHRDSIVEALNIERFKQRILYRFPDARIQSVLAGIIIGFLYGICLH